MKFETVRIYFSSEFSVCCQPKILLQWQRDVTTSSLYQGVSLRACFGSFQRGTGGIANR